MNYYPSSIKLLANLIGWENVLKILQAFQGKRYLYIPKKILPTHPLWQILPAEVIAQIHAHYAQTTVFLPRCVALRKAQRNAQIVAEKQKGDKITVIAQRHNLSYEMVLKIVNKVCTNES